MEKNKSNVEYKVYLIGYTDSRGKRTRVKVAEENKAKAILTLEEVLINLGYSEKNIENLCVVLKDTKTITNKSYINFAC